jgi:hypothetical protein
MNAVHSLWAIQSDSVRLIILCLVATAAIPLARFVRLAHRLYRNPGAPLGREDVLKGAVAPDILAGSALANWALCKTMASRPATSGPPTGRASQEQVRRILREAEIAFLYLWDSCYADVKSARRASVVTLLLSMVMVTYGESAVYSDCFDNGIRTGYACMFLTVEQLLHLLAFGLSLCTLLYLVSSCFRRTLAMRKASWDYFCARLRDELSRE